MALRSVLDQYRTDHAEDPWCIGYFVNNEIPMATISTPDLYFKIVREEMRRAAPNKLYLGSRNHTGLHLAEAAKHCDVVSLNRYTLSAKNIDLNGIDRPVLIGEFHFGALDRGMLHTGLSSAGSQKQKIDNYSYYMHQALKNPLVIGAHWFRYGEQMVTGRKDGENFQVGFLDVCDTPYKEMVKACRDIGDNMYDLRWSHPSPVNLSFSEKKKKNHAF